MPGSTRRRIWHRSDGRHADADSGRAGVLLSYDGPAISGTVAQVGRQGDRKSLPAKQQLGRHTASQAAREGRACQVPSYQIPDSPSDKSLHNQIRRPDLAEVADQPKGSLVRTLVSLVAKNGSDKILVALRWHLETHGSITYPRSPPRPRVAPGIMGSSFQPSFAGMSLSSRLQGWPSMGQLGQVISSRRHSRPSLVAIRCRPGHGMLVERCPTP
ncbi:hypothetical protein BP6252_13443 [Coleophoma cylindrospora]|uniref:Uncharacterized protein n=1 Tax=Coleophoma cylindrospora TaxID=1849047 RepID=A0A3D8Q876_9HELO|nr:hypothetical protein BP6252_13443 [Coleophoma cylindrospora]